MCRQYMYWCVEGVLIVYRWVDESISTVSEVCFRCVGTTCIGVSEYMLMTYRRCTSNICIGISDLRCDKSKVRCGVSEVC